MRNSLNTTCLHVGLEGFFWRRRGDGVACNGITYITMAWRVFYFYFLQSSHKQESQTALKRRLEQTPVPEFPRHRLRMLSKLSEGNYGAVSDVSHHLPIDTTRQSVTAIRYSFVCIFNCFELLSFFTRFFPQDSPSPQSTIPPWVSVTVRTVYRYVSHTTLVLNNLCIDVSWLFYIFYFLTFSSPQINSFNKTNKKSLLNCNIRER